MNQGPNPPAGSFKQENLHSGSGPSSRPSPSSVERPGGCIPGSDPLLQGTPAGSSKLLGSSWTNPDSFPPPFPCVFGTSEGKDALLCGRRLSTSLTRRGNFSSATLWVEERGCLAFRAPMRKLLGVFQRFPLYLRRAARPPAPRGPPPSQTAGTCCNPNPIGIIRIQKGRRGWLHSRI